MAAYASDPMPQPMRCLPRKAAIVGIRESDYPALYKAAQQKAAGYEPAAVEDLTHGAFEAALADAGLERDDIDGLSVSLI